MAAGLGMGCLCMDGRLMPGCFLAAAASAARLFCSPADESLHDCIRWTMYRILSAVHCHVRFQHSLAKKLPIPTLAARACLAASRGVNFGLSSSFLHK
jgi:hypothetical protein